MSTRTATRSTQPAPGAAPEAAARADPPRRLFFLLAAVVAPLAVALTLAPWADHAVQEVILPLRHDDIIRQQAADKDLDPALIAGVIYAESRFRDQTSHAGAKGLMQLMPEHRRLHRPQVRRDGVRAGRPRDAAGQHRLRVVVPALPARPLRRQRGARARRVQRGGGQGRRVVAPARRARRALPRGRPHPVRRDARLRRKVLDARERYRRAVRARARAVSAAAWRAAARSSPGVSRRAGDRPRGRAPAARARRTGVVVAAATRRTTRRQPWGADAGRRADALAAELGGLAGSPRSSTSPT